MTHWKQTYHECSLGGTLQSLSFGTNGKLAVMANDVFRLADISLKPLGIFGYYIIKMFIN